MFKRIQGFIIGIFTCALLFGGIVFAADYVIKPNTIPIEIDGVQNDDIQALNIDDRTWFQLASLKEVGLGVKFNEITKKIEITKDTSFVPVDFDGIKGYNKNGDIYISLKDALANKSTLVNDLLGIQSATSPSIITSEPMSPLDAATLKSATANGLTGITYNNVFYAETSSIVQKYNIMLTQKNTVCTIISRRTGQSLTLNQTADGFIKDTNGTYYLNYNTIKSMIDTSDLVTQPTTPPEPTKPAESAKTLTAAEVDALQTTTQDSMTGVTYNSAFFVEKESFVQKYNAKINGIDSIVISYSGNIYTVATQMGKVVQLKQDIDGYLKNSTGTVYFNFNALQPIIK